MSDSQAARSANALMFGAALGLAVGMLVAPRSGRENRERLKHEYEKTRDQLQKGAQQASDKIRTTAQRKKHEAEQMVDETGIDVSSAQM